MTKPIIPPLVSRMVATAALVLAFVVMASIFVPDPIEAQDNHWPQPIDRIDWHEREHDSQSTDPYAGLALIGALEHACCFVYIYSTDHGPRYSVYEKHANDLRAVGTLLSVEQMERHFPDLPLKNVEFMESRQYMLATPDEDY